MGTLGYIYIYIYVWKRESKLTTPSLLLLFTLLLSAALGIG